MKNTAQKPINPLLMLGGVVICALIVSFAMLKKDGNTQSTEGERLFNENCASCHGVGAVGEEPETNRMGGTREDGTYIAPALNGTAHAFHHSSDLLFKIIKFGSSTSDSQMKGFGEQLADDQIREVMDYFKSLWPEDIRKRHSGRQ